MSIRSLWTAVLALCGAALAQTEQSVFPGWENAATGGGGRALPAGVGAAFLNPAAQERNRFSGWTGGSTFGGPLDFPDAWTAASLPVSGGAWITAAASVPHTEEWKKRQGGALSAAFVPFPGVSTSARTSLWVDAGDGSSMDLDLAMRFQTTRWLFWSLSGDNLLQNHASAGSQKNPGFLGTVRSLNLGVAGVLDSAQHASLWYDLEAARSGVPDGIVHRAGLRLVGGPRDVIELRGGVSAAGVVPSDRGVWSGNAGVSVSHRFYGQRLTLAYAASGFAGPSDPVHSVSFSIIFHAYADKENPRPFARSGSARFHASEGTLLVLRAEDGEGDVAHWTLKVVTADSTLQTGTEVRRWSGEGLPPRTLAWDAKDPSGAFCPPGIYAYQLQVEDRAGNASRTAWGYLEIVAE